MRTSRWRYGLLGIAAAALLVAVAYGVVVIGGGFSALDEPSRLEVALASAIRHLSVPRRARAETNPLTATPELLAEARELYVVRCAGCHGHPGGARSDIGHKLYPRAPDLSSADAQRLTDGELHYIIENGIRLTGMPAWHDADVARNADNWKLVLLIRSLASPGDEELSAAAQAPAAEYVGSEACRDCHTEIYDRWIDTPMANILVDVDARPEAILGDFSTPNPLVTFSPDDVDFTYGSLWKQRYFTRIGDDYFVLPAQWDVMNKVWRRYYVSPGTDWWVEHYPADQMQRPTGPLCDGCHSTNYDIRTKTVTEWNVGCEKCHGPGSVHAAQPTRANIVDPARLNHVAANDVCIQCHSQGQPLDNPIDGRYYDWPVGYEVGRPLADYWHLEEHTLGEQTFTHYAEGSAHKNRMQGNDYVQSAMYQHGVTCSSCHDVHGTEHYAQLRKAPQALCLDCHGPGSVNGPYAPTLEAHTHHAADSEGSQCIGCHMPKTAAEIADIKVRSHTFHFVTPEMTERYGIPNGCTSCHTEESNAWAQQALLSWPEHSPWRLGADTAAQEN